ncbi:MAG: aminodeoxychorismate synthase component I [Azospira oryzae]|jgi:para-aminobenzoate synthetase component 1|nr:MAG: aminodeoxychorismate synthase component I [Azospira oryzae]
MTITEFRSTLNQWGQQQVPFLFAVDFEMEKPLAWRLDEIDPGLIKYDVRGVSNTVPKKTTERIQLNKFPVAIEVYKEQFDKVMSHLDYGDSFLTNLTVKTKIEINSSPEQLFDLYKAPYKLYMKDQFLVFSPESFIRIKDGRIFSFPMKGTIDATIKNAAEIIIHDQKELSEHVTIVDLIRNDLSIVSSNVTVKRFRYIEEIKTDNKNLLQVSSEIVGDLPADYGCRIGDLLISLLPAGSVSGAPKPKTMDIIREAEKEKRGYYTGVFGCFDGCSLDSGVMIRFIEQEEDRFFYRSGGGITTQSTLQSEYQEMIDKIYVTVH